MPPRRAIQAPSSPAGEEKAEEAPATPSPIKRKLQQLEEARKLTKRTPSRMQGVKLTKYLVEDDIVAFSVEGECTLMVMCLLFRVWFCMFAGETYRPPVKDVLMGRGNPPAGPTPRARFHTSANVSDLFINAGRPAPGSLQKTAWWHFKAITVPGDAPELLAVHDRIVQQLQALALDSFPVVEGPTEELTVELVEDLALLWPPLAVEET